MTLPGWLEPLLDARGMRAVDAWAIEKAGVPSLRLMEAAGEALAEAVRDLARAAPIRVVCGKGNNGGDGLVAARLLRATGYQVDVLLLWPGDELSADARANLERLEQEPRVVDVGDLKGALAGSGAVVDALLGTGSSGEPRSPVAEAIAAINGCRAPVVAADVASGVDASTGEVAGEAVEADCTVAFHAAKLGHLIAPGKRATGELRVVGIGIPAGAPAEPAAGAICDEVLRLAPPRGAASTKFSSGQVLVAGGSRGLTGAVCLCASAAVRAGAGYATVAVPDELEPIFEAKLTEVMSIGCESTDGALAEEAASQVLEAGERAAALVLGPGLGRTDAAAALARRVAARARAPLVLDADGLNAHAGSLDALAAREGPTILTPHAGELARLLERSAEEVSARRLESARDAAASSRAVVVLKGDDTVVADGRSEGSPVAVNALPSPALATAGTGDVLAGMIAALVARGLDPFAAACAAVLAHARAGRAAAERIGAAESVIAGDVIDAIPAGLRP